VDSKGSGMIPKLRAAIAAGSLVLGITGCSVAAHVSQHSPTHENQNLQPKRYFPSSEFADVRPGSILVPTFEEHLATLDEPSLYDQPRIHYAVRVTWLTPFYGDAMLRIEDTGEQVSFVYKRRPTIAAPDTKSNATLRGEIKRSAFAGLVEMIQKDTAFSLTNKQDVVATDGTIWLLEVFDGKRYHAVYRIGPFSTPVQNIGRHAASLANINIDELE
jgi:hypothetical protein